MTLVVDAGRIALLTGAGFVAIALVTAVPGREPPPVPPPAPDPAREVSEGMTPPHLLSELEVLSHLGYLATTSPQLEGEVDFRLRVDDEGHVGTWEPWRWSGDDGIVHAMDPLIHRLRFSPARDETARPVPVWWTFSVSLPAPLVLAPDNYYAPSGVGGPEAPEGGYSVADLLDELPVFTPMTDLPALLNPKEVASAASRECQDLPRDRGDRVWPRVFFLLDTDGRVRRTRLHVPTWVDDVDEAALQVASVHRFAPARYGGRPVVAWVSLLIDLGPRACAIQKGVQRTRTLSAGEPPTG